MRGEGRRPASGRRDLAAGCLGSGLALSVGYWQIGPEYEAAEYMGAKGHPSARLFAGARLDTIDIVGETQQKRGWGECLINDVLPAVAGPVETAMLDTLLCNHSAAASV